MRYATTDLHVSYQASTEPQELRFSVTINPKYGRIESGLFKILQFGKLGYIGGAEFPPEAGLIEGSRDLDVTSNETEKHFRVTVAALSPVFLRNVIQELSFGPKVTSMNVVGTLPLDGSPLSVDSKRARSWFDNQTTYFPDRWSQLGYELSESPSNSGVQLTVKLLEDVNQEHVDLLEWVLSAWPLGLYPKRDLSSEGGMDVQQRIARTKREIRMGKREFDFSPKPAADLLLNSLCALKRRGQLPIESVSLAI